MCAFRFWNKTFDESDWTLFGIDIKTLYESDWTLFGIDFKLTLDQKLDVYIPWYRLFGNEFIGTGMASFCTELRSYFCSIRCLMAGCPPCDTNEFLLLILRK